MLRLKIRKIDIARFFETKQNQLKQHNLNFSDEEL